MKFLMLLYIVSVILAADLARGSTYVGNGGTSEDAELKDTLTQIEESLLRAQTTLPNRLCRCDSGGRMCGPLDQISGQQADECATFIKTQTPAVLALIRDQKIRWTWIDQDMKVQEGDMERSVDAVADERTMTVTLHRGRFAALSSTERQFLLTHEIFHLAPFQSRYIKDTDSVGAFKGRSGGRDLINAAAAAVTNALPAKAAGGSSQIALEPKIPSHEKTYWIELDFPSRSSNFDRATLDMGSSRGLLWRYRHQLGRWNAQAYFGNLETRGKALTSISLREELSLVGLGFGYRWQIGSRPESYWGRAHVLASAHLEHQRSSLEISDPLIGEKASDQGFGVGASLKLLLPVGQSSWFTIETGTSPKLSTYEFKQAETTIKSISGRAYTNWGFSYAF